MQEISSEGGQRQHVIETAMALLLVSVLIAATFWVLLPFVGVLIYAVILATATAELFDRMVVVLGDRRRLAAILFGTLAAVITIVPLVYLSSAMVDLVGVVLAWIGFALAGVPGAIALAAVTFFFTVPACSSARRCWPCCGQCSRPGLAPTRDHH